MASRINLNVGDSIVGVTEKNLKHFVKRLREI
ncbi:hypothetical protein [Escherichia phage vB_EcoM_ULIM3]|nr:hypothetical protein [Escherichia phage vB_EcoM_ULIM3]